MKYSSDAADPTGDASPEVMKKYFTHCLTISGDPGVRRLLAALTGNGVVGDLPPQRVGRRAQSAMLSAGGRMRRFDP